VVKWVPLAKNLGGNNPMKSPRWSLLASLLVVLFVCACPGVVGHAATNSLSGLKCEYKVDPLGLDVAQPRLSWQVSSKERGWLQTAYQVRVAQSQADLNQGKNLTWDSGKVASSESVHRVYAGPALESGRRYYWQVRVWDAQGQPSAWSDAAR
jgi:alpha-L-rhamnosidase